MSFSIKAGDEKPHLSSQLGGGPDDWTGASAQIVVKRNADGAVAQTLSATLDTATKVVQFDWTGFDTSIVGEYHYEWLVTFADGDEMTAPGDVAKSFNIKARVG